MKMFRIQRKSDGKFKSAGMTGWTTHGKWWHYAIFKRHLALWREYYSRKISAREAYKDCDIVVYDAVETERLTIDEFLKRPKETF